MRTRPTTRCGPSSPSRPRSRNASAPNLRADSAHTLVDLAVANPSFTVRKVEAELSLSYGKASKLVGQLVELGILAAVDPNAYNRRFYAPGVLCFMCRVSPRLVNPSELP